MKQFKFRIPDDLHAEIERAAEASGRTLTAEMIERLRRSFDREAMLDDVRRVLREANQEALSTLRGLSDEGGLVFVDASGLQPLDS